MGSWAHARGGTAGGEPWGTCTPDRVNKKKHFSVNRIREQSLQEITEAYHKVCHRMVDQDPTKFANNCELNENCGLHENLPKAELP